MKYNKLGRSGLMVSKLCLGTMNFGAITPEKESYKIMDRALELGINFLIRQMFTVVKREKVLRKKLLANG